MWTPRRAGCVGATGWVVTVTLAVSATPCWSTACTVTTLSDDTSPTSKRPRTTGTCWPSTVTVTAFSATPVRITGWVAGAPIRAGRTSRGPLRSTVNVRLTDDDFSGNPLALTTRTCSPAVRSLGRARKMSPSRSRGSSVPSTRMLRPSVPGPLAVATTTKSASWLRRRSWPSVTPLTSTTGDAMARYSATQPTTKATTRNSTSHRTGAGVRRAWRRLTALKAARLPSLFTGAMDRLVTFRIASTGSVSHHPVVASRGAA